MACQLKDMKESDAKERYLRDPNNKDIMVMNHKDHPYSRVAQKYEGLDFDNSVDQLYETQRKKKMRLRKKYFLLHKLLVKCS